MFRLFMSIIWYQSLYASVLLVFTICVFNKKYSEFWYFGVYVFQKFLIKNMVINHQEMIFLTFHYFKSSICCLEYMETVGFHFGSQMGQTYPVESRKQLHGLIVLTVNKKEISKIEIRKGVVAQLVLSLHFPSQCPGSTPLSI